MNSHQVEKYSALGRAIIDLAFEDATSNKPFMQKARVKAVDWLTGQDDPDQTLRLFSDFADTHYAKDKRPYGFKDVKQRARRLFEHER